ncbi:MAG: hypothetical protein NDI61_10190 [Bdellovibrionaceae bacterium]|nr:hypothetical protein [Pseudobdellovibrionaceae bacterium]
MKTPTSNVKQSTRGMALLEVITAVGIFSILLVSYLQTADILRSWLLANDAKLTLQSLRSEFVSTLRDDVSWSQILGNTSNSSLDCLESPSTWSACPSRNNNTYGGAFIVELAQSGLIFNPLANADHGFTIDGQPCSSYPSMACPLRLDLKWTRLCELSCGSDPLIEVSGVFTTNPHLRLRSDAYSFSMIRPLSVTVLPNVLPRISFRHGVTKTWEDASPAPTAEVTLNYPAPVPITFDICVERNPKNESCYPPMHARPGIDMPAYGTCNSFTIPQSSTGTSVPLYVLNNDSTLAFPSCFISEVAAVSYSLYIQNVTGANLGPLSMHEVVVIDKRLRLNLTSAQIDTSNVLRIAYETQASPFWVQTFALRNSRHEMIQFGNAMNMRSSNGVWNLDFNVIRATQPVGPGTELKVCRYISFGVACSNLITVTGP